MTPKVTLIISGVVGLAAVGLLEVQNRGGSTTVFQATTAVRAGAPLESAVRPVSVPRNTFSQMASTVPSVELEQFVRSTPLARDVQPGDIIQFDMLLRSASEGLTIATGMRAVAIDIGRSSQAVGYLIRPGDFVDVVGTIVENDVPTSRTILQARKVLAVGQQYRLEDSAFLQARTYNSVTLEVTPAEAETIEHHRTLTRDGFMLTLRPKGDTAATVAANPPAPVPAVRP